MKFVLCHALFYAILVCASETGFSDPTGVNSVHATDAKSCYSFSQFLSRTKKRENDSSVLAIAQHGGYFPPPSAEKLQEVEEQYLSRNKSKQLTIKVDGEIGVVSPEDLVTNFSRMTQPELISHRTKGLNHLKASRAPPSEIITALKGSDYNGISPLYYFTSAAGLWSRGGGFIKFLVPLNLNSLLDPTQRQALIRAGEIVSAKTTSDVLRIAGLTEQKDGHDEERAKAVSEQAKEKVHMLLGSIARKPTSINILDLKFAQIALLSKISGSYIHFDIWTSEKTHGATREYLEWFKKNFRSKTFHPDPAVNKSIHDALEKYFLASQKLGETHLFGYQEGIYALDAKSGRSLLDTEPIGEGAGMYKHYLDKTGRTSQLKNRGVSEMVFQNLEVISDMPLEYSSFKAANKPVAVVVVPTMSGYSGGNPYKVTKGGSVSYQLLEQSAVLESIRALNSPFFNSNTIYQSLDLPYVSNIGYESKENGRQIRLKTNAGDLTLVYPTALIGGRIGHEYENFKDFREYILHGESTIKTLQDLWESLIK